MCPSRLISLLVARLIACCVLLATAACNRVTLEAHRDVPLNSQLVGPHSIATYDGQSVRQTRNDVAVTLHPTYLLRDAIFVISEQCDWAVDLEDSNPLVQDGTLAVTLKWKQSTSLCEDESHALRGMLRAFNSRCSPPLGIAINPMCLRAYGKATGTN
jgi:hypothetical protein